MIKKRDKTKKKSYFILIIIILLIAIIIGIFFLPKINFFAINSEEGNFNLKLEIPESHKSINPGDNIVFSTKIINLANQKRIDVTLKFSIIDYNKNIVVSKSETVAIETQASFIRELNLPENTFPGKYTLKSELIYNDIKGAEGEENFEVIKKDNKRNYLPFIIIILTVILIIILLYLTSRLKPFIEKIKIKLKIHKMIKNRLK